MVAAVGLRVVWRLLGMKMGFSDASMDKAYGIKGVAGRRTQER